MQPDSTTPTHRPAHPFCQAPLPLLTRCDARDLIAAHLPGELLHLVTHPCLHALVQAAAALGAAIVRRQVEPELAAAYATGVHDAEVAAQVWYARRYER